LVKKVVITLYIGDMDS